MEPAAWRLLARHRIKKILTTYLAATAATLEIKISECGPPKMRAEPFHINAALHELIAEGTIRVRFLDVPGGRFSQSAPSVNSGWIVPVFYLTSIADQHLPDLSTRFERLKWLLAEWRLIQFKPPSIGVVGERRCDIAIRRSGHYEFLAATDRSSGRSLLFDFRLRLNYIPSNIVPAASGPLTLGVEVKNSRRWIYPADRRLWELIIKALSTETDVPIIVARKLSYVTFLFLKHIGCLGFQTHVQYVSSRYVKITDGIRHKAGLGYKDIRFVRVAKSDKHGYHRHEPSLDEEIEAAARDGAFYTSAYRAHKFRATDKLARYNQPTLERFWKYTVPVYAHKAHTRWLQATPILIAFVVKHKPLQLNTEQRSKAIKSLWDELKQLPFSEFDVDQYKKAIQSRTKTARAKFLEGYDSGNDDIIKTPDFPDGFTDYESWQAYNEDRDF